MGDLRFGQRVFAILFQTGSKPLEICGFSLLQRANCPSHRWQAGLIAPPFPQNGHGIDALGPWSVSQSRQMEAIHPCRSINRSFR